MKKIIRKTWPRIRLVVIRGIEFYQVDCRKQGTSGKREHYRSKNEAEKRAREVAGEFETQGTEGFSLTYEMRSVLLDSQNKLKPFGKSLADAVAFYIQHLQDEEKKAGSLYIRDLSLKWYLDRKGDTNKPLRKDTLDGILESHNRLKAKFGNVRIGDLSKEDFEPYFRALNLTNRRKYNIKSGFSQFFNWCIRKNYASRNPLVDIEIVPESKDVEIFEVSEIERIFKKLDEKEWNPLLPYFAVCTYAGLRPTEAEGLTWENIYLEERQIKVLGSTSKTKETRNVHIEDKLLKILSGFEGDKTGLIIKNGIKKPRCYIERFKVALGYNVNGKNPDGMKWIADGLRHTYGSYWLAKYNDRPKLAELMGNSPKMIRDHYKAVVKASDVEKFWG